MLILCLCPERYHWKLIPGYAAAFRRQGIEFFCAGEGLRFDAPIDGILKLCPSTPSWIFHFESALPLLPQRLEKCEVPTVCFHPDTYAFTRRRIHWSFLFDHAVVFHPGYERIYAQAGHRDAFLLPHAVRREFFCGPEMQRDLEIGWVGQMGGILYRRRSECLPRLAREFRTNDWSRQCTLEEVAEVYRRSRIVVNIGRDDFPQDANQRVFEAMASGALLLTALPTELTEIGFQEGVHFIGYEHDQELSVLVKQYLRDDSARERIAAAGREKVLSEHTYDQRATQLLSHLQRAGQKRLAPARAWPEKRARLMALNFYAAHGLLDCAGAQFWGIAGRGFRETIEGSALLARASLRRCRGALRAGKRKIFCYPFSGKVGSAGEAPDAPGLSL